MGTIELAVDILNTRTAYLEIMLRILVNDEIGRSVATPH
jgi:hypothetical protein